MPATNAALKMAAPGELCSQLKKLMVFCKDNARSIKSMRQHLAVTQTVIDDLLKQALEQKLLWKQSNGMYKTFNTKFVLVEPDPNSLLALADTAEPASNEQTADNTTDEVIDIDADLDALVEQGLVKTDGEHYQLGEIDVSELQERSGFDMSAMASEFEQEQQRNEYPVFDDIQAKERALHYCSLILQPGSSELRRCIESIQVDYAVIRLHQNRRA